MAEQASNNVPQIRFKGFEGGWEKRRLRDITVNLSGGASIKPGDYQKDGVRTVPKGAVNSSGIADLSGCKYVSSDFFTRHQSSKASTGNLITSLRDLVPSAPNLGRIVKIEGQSEDFLMPQGVYKIELHLGVDEAFVISYSNGEKFRKIISSEKNGSTQVHLRNGEFLDIGIAKPPHLEQAKIGEYFRQLDSLIGLHQRKHDKLVMLKKAMLQKMFPQPGATTPEIRFKGFEGDWDEKRLDEICEIVGGGTPSTSIPEYWGGDIDWYSPTEIGDKVYASESVKKITLLGLSKCSAKLLPPGKTVLFTSRAGIGDMAILTKEGCTNQGFQSMVLNGGADPYFVFSMGHLIKSHALKHASGSTFLEVSSKQLGKMRILLPKKNEQQKIGTYFRALDELISQHATQLQKLQQIKSACLERMFV